MAFLNKRLRIIFMVMAARSVKAELYGKPEPLTARDQESHFLISDQNGSNSGMKVKNGDLRPEIAFPTSGKTVWWHEPECGHSWQQKIADRGVAELQCPVCAGDIFLRRSGRRMTTKGHPANWKYLRDDSICLSKDGSEISVAWSPMRSKSVVIFKTDETLRNRWQRAVSAT